MTTSNLLEVKWWLARQETVDAYRLDPGMLGPPGNSVD